MSTSCTNNRSVRSLLLMVMAILVAGPAAVGESTGQVSAHEGLPCSDCHSSTARGELEGVSAGSSAQRCRECHEAFAADSQGVSLGFHEDSRRNCLDCHGFHDSRSISATEGSFEFDFSDAGLRHHCSSCHAPGGDLSLLSEGHVAAADFYHSDHETLAELTPSESCLACHSVDGPDVEMPDQNAPAPRFNERASHAFGIRVVAGMRASRNHFRAQLDDRIRLFDGRMECQTCHQIAANNKDLLVEFDTPYALCLGCHQHSSQPQRVASR